MCGIAGIWHLNKRPLETEKLKRFTDSMEHRGPDGSGYHVFEDVQLGFGHRRLSILDLSEAGKQPMSFADGRYWITYNGEVYNFLELKSELEKLGYSFKTDSDTEIILAAYHKWGKECLKKFNGMWAIAIYDTQEQKLFLTRDRFGVKPLHYVFLPGKLFAFASETIAFKNLEGFNRSFNNTTLSHSIYSFNSIEPWGYTLFNDVYQLMPGHYIELKRGEKVKQKKWWDTFENLTVAPAKYEDQVEEFRELFMDACKLRMRSDVSIASALSGGVDSSSVYCMLHHLMKSSKAYRIPGDWQKAFVATFPNTAVDERHYAEEVVKFTNGNAKYIVPDYSNLVNDIKKATILFDGIAATPITAVTDIYKAMRNNGITVSLDGHGVDEMIYGYNASAAEAYLSAKLSGDEAYAADLLDICLEMQPPSKSEAIKNRLNVRYKSIKEFDARINSQNPLKKIAKKIIKKTLGNQNAIGPLADIEWLNTQTVPSLHFLSEQHYRFQNLSRAESHLANDFHINSIPYNLRDFDRGAMQHSIEIRMPFMDYRLVTYLFSLETKSKIGHGYTKRILRDSMKGIMPESIRTRKLKIGLGAPMTDWFSHEMAEFISDEISSSRFLGSQIWNGPLIKEFALSRIKNKNWTMPECSRFWQVFNAHLLLTN
ncbi:MAG: asparagine synthase (glutamine-hydrolyzing) [Bacteroidia bacterium]